MANAKEADSLSKKNDCVQLLVPSSNPPRMTEDEHWLASGLNYKSLLSYKLINERQCRKSQLDFVICISAINALSQNSSQPYLLLPRALLAEYRTKIISVELEFGGLLLVKIQMNLAYERGDHVERTFLDRRESEQTYRNALSEMYRDSSFKFRIVLQEVVKRIRDQAKEGSQTAAAFNTAFSFEDPHAYLAPTNLLEESDSTAGIDRLVGVGVVIKNIAGHYHIAKVIEGGPADMAGLRSGDVILAIDEQPVEQMIVQELLRMVTGKEGTAVRFTVKRKSESLKITVVRRDLELRNVESALISDGVKVPVGYIYLRSFAYPNACDEVRGEVMELISQGAKKLVFDLRDNKGGLLSQGTCIAGLFVGKKIVATRKPLVGSRHTPIFSEQIQITDLPMVILVNGESASASEMVPGALRDHHRAWILGVRSFGKATIQHALPYDDEAKIMFFKTEEMFYQPSGSSNQVVGIEPNFTVFQSPYLENEEFIAREIDIYPHAFPGSRKKWREDRTAEVRVLKDCIETVGVAKAKWQRLTDAGANADYQKLKALDLLNCM